MLKTRVFPLADQLAGDRRSSASRRIQNLQNLPSAHRIMGVDPGLQTTGYGIIEIANDEEIAAKRDGVGRTAPQWTLRDAGVVKASATAPFAIRLQTLHEGLREALALHEPEVVVIEELFSTYAHPRAALLMAHARGVLMLAAQQAGASVHTFLPNEVKQVVTGNGHANKTSVQAAVRQRLRLACDPEPHDVADALALALCFAARQQLGDRIRKRARATSS